jgi:putative peptidoglycan lipid II flippase
LSAPRSPSPPGGSTARKAGKVSAAIFGSRILGLVREAVFAHLFGAGAASDAFRAAFKIPNLLRDLFAEGALSSAFVTTFTKTLESRGSPAAWRLANLTFTALTCALTLIVLLGILGAPWLVELLGGPLPAPTKALAIGLTRVMFPFILLVSAAAIMMGLLNAHHRFGLPASASMFFNLGSILVGVGCAWCLDPHFGPSAIYGMAIGVLAGGALQFLIQVPAAYRLGFRFTPAWEPRNDGFRAILRLLGPAVIGASAVQINVLVNTRFAAEVGPGAISWLEYAFRLMQFPIGLLGVAIATVTLPAVSRDAARADVPAFRNNLGRSVRLALALTIPAAAGLAVLSEPIIRLIYERGRFSPTDTLATAAALQAYALGLPGYAAIKVLSPAFYALDDPKTPLRVSLLGIFINFGLNYSFVRIFHWDQAGLALGTSMVAILNFTQLSWAMRRRLDRFEGRALASLIARTLLCAAAMGYAVHSLIAWLEPWRTSFLHNLLFTLLGVAVGMIVFLAGAQLLRITEVTDISAAIYKKIVRLRRPAP